MIRQARITDARHRANLFKEASVESSAAGFVVAKCVHIQSGRNCIARVESGIDRARVEETPQTQAGADEQHDTRGHLHDDERVSKTRPRRSAMHRSILQVFYLIQLRLLKRWDEAE